MPKIMIVDDDRTTVSLLKTLLELDGFEVALAPDGATAFDRALETGPDAFLVDYHLAELEGTDFVRRVRETERFRDTPVIMTSGLNRRDEAHKAGADRFLIKPFDPSELVRALNELLELP